MSETVRSNRENGVCTITLNRPARLNAINAALVGELDAALRGAHQDSKTRVIVLRGEGRAFCAGDDLIDFPEQAKSAAVARQFVEAIQEITRLIVFRDKIVLGAVHGWAVGGGFEWMLNCDLVLMAEGTRCFMPETKLGMVPTGAATVLLPRLIGYQRARAMILLGEQIDARQALDMGLVWRVVSETSLFDEAQSLGERIAELPERGVRDTKHLLNPSHPLSVEEALLRETELVVPAFIEPETIGRTGSFKP